MNYLLYFINYCNIIQLHVFFQIHQMFHLPLLNTTWHHNTVLALLAISSLSTVGEVNINCRLIKASSRVSFLASSFEFVRIWFGVRLADNRTPLDG